MVTVYRADNALDAYIVKDFLSAEGLDARVDGEYLQGGVGMLPTMGMVSVSVPEPQQARARELIREWERR